MPNPVSQTGEGAATGEQLDTLVLATADATYVKVAVFIARVVDAAKAAGVEATGQSVAARIYALVDAGSLEAKGNVRRWRAGEVRRAADRS